MSNVTQFQIKNLYGYKNFEINIKDNTIILVGENGSGKTTVLRLLFYFLSAQWRMLSLFQFEEIVIKIDDKTYVLQYSLLQKKIKSHHMLRRLPPSIRHEIDYILRKNYDKPIDLDLINNFSNKYGIPVSYFIHDFDEESGSFKELDKISNDIRNSLQAQILYLPTYRRIEQELNFILKVLILMKFKNEDDLKSLKKAMRYMLN